MTRFRNVRILPLVIAAIAGMVVLKVSGLLMNGHYIFGPPRFSEEAVTGSVRTVPARTSGKSWAEEMLNFPGGHKAEPPDVTGSAPPSKPKNVESPASKAIELKPIEGEVVLPDSRKTISDTERAVLERLQERNRALDARARELEIRESLLKATEKKLEARSDEIKSVQNRATEADRLKSAAEAERYKGLVTMYESMKPKDAAKIFDRLEMRVLYEVVTKISPRKMAEILAQMSPAAAERLTVEIAARAGAIETDGKNGALPKIEGKPTAEQSVSAKAARR